eukprot:gnl/TRDRNA2_/TRDRNA2_63143_c0_seq2.p1 gnl/TRDRNA2_/TRDRNA2_63143_c0~~gnl/TRDRNA2_/TRDRNA2_63143_c0_seq2.p1  ORF type:complete len:155 (-),score=39.64 gnl/TRDRNA2_/TRDRNA2_63143_c0_seq2:5-412(-)
MDMDDLDDADPPPLQAPTDPLGRKPRVAVLHGGSANPDIMRKQLKPFITKLDDDVELLFIEGKLVTKEVRFDDRGKRNMETMEKFFGAKPEDLREHAVTTYGEKGEEGPFSYDHLDEAIEHSEAKLKELAPARSP